MKLKCLVVWILGGAGAAAGAVAVAVSVLSVGSGCCGGGDLVLGEVKSIGEAKEGLKHLIIKINKIKREQK